MYIGENYVDNVAMVLGFVAAALIVVLILTWLKSREFKKLVKLEYRTEAEWEWPTAWAARVIDDKIAVYPNKDPNSAFLFTIGVKRMSKVIMAFGTKEVVLTFDPNKIEETAREILEELKMRLPEYFKTQTK